MANDLKLSRKEHNLIKDALSDDIKEGLTYDFMLVNNNSNLKTVVKRMPISTIITLLKGFEGSVKKNIKDGLTAVGGHKNSRTGSSKVTKL